MTNKFGMNDIEFQNARKHVKEYINHLMLTGGYPAVEKAYFRYKALVESGEADNEDKYRLMVLGNVLVMA